MTADEAAFAEQAATKLGLAQAWAKLAQPKRDEQIERCAQRALQLMPLAQNGGVSLGLADDRQMTEGGSPESLRSALFNTAVLFSFCL